VLSFIACGTDSGSLEPGADGSPTDEPSTPTGPIPNEFVFVLEPALGFFAVELDLPEAEYEWLNGRSVAIDIAVRSFDFRIRDVRTDRLVPVLSADGDCQVSAPDTVTAQSVVLRNECLVTLDVEDRSTAVSDAVFEVRIAGPAGSARIEAEGMGFQRTCRLDQDNRSRRCRWDDPSQTVVLRARPLDGFTQFIEFRPLQDLSGPRTLNCERTNRFETFLDIGALRNAVDGPLHIGCAAMFDCTPEARLESAVVTLDQEGGRSFIDFMIEDLDSPGCHRVVHGPTTVTRCDEAAFVSARNFMVGVDIQSTGPLLEPTSYRTPRGEFSLATRHPGSAGWLEVEFSHCGDLYILYVDFRG